MFPTNDTWACKKIVLADLHVTSSIGKTSLVLVLVKLMMLMLLFNVVAASWLFSDGVILSNFVALFTKKLKKLKEDSVLKSEHHVAEDFC